jgi:hypothetical protein
VPHRRRLLERRVRRRPSQPPPRVPQPCRHGRRQPKIGSDRAAQIA